MKTIIYGMVMSLGLVANGALAEQMISVDGVEYTLSSLMANCQEKNSDPAEQIACFNNVSQLIQEQSVEEEADALSVPEALDALRSLAQYQDDETGLAIVGEGCSIRIVYFNNYFHISRRNISNIDLFSAAFDVSKLQLDRSVGVAGSQAPLSRGQMEAGAAASVIGGMALDSAQNGFEPKSARETIADFAIHILGQLPNRADEAFEFVLVHPKRSDAGAEIWGAFESFAKACQR
ncbi:hypothetical protein [Jannaschia pohangensis]|uniref:Uncharacterized protein n=1 Tax=Jannaschia pohangensis TaxID=390807 RepID=A0A1I3UIM1_9RHOB|nr:hypothetical protein [Jannaschia pohangensis]SFJ83334.1 hypothetical protein SAMN04488095_3786 [Jannaschia pohangensis]